MLGNRSTGTPKRQGPNRRGERAEQMDLRTRIARAVQRALAASSLAWHELPHSLESWDDTNAAD